MGISSSSIDYWKNFEEFSVLPSYQEPSLTLTQWIASLLLRKKWDLFKQHTLALLASALWTYVHLMGTGWKSPLTLGTAGLFFSGNSCGAGELQLNHSQRILQTEWVGEVSEHLFNLLYAPADSVPGSQGSKNETLSSLSHLSKEGTTIILLKRQRKKKNGVEEAGLVRRIHRHASEQFQITQINSILCPSQSLVELSHPPEKPATLCAIVRLSPNAGSRREPRHPLTESLGCEKSCFFSRMSSSFEPKQAPANRLLFAVRILKDINTNN